MSITNSCLEADDFLPSEHAPSERCFVKALEAEFSWQVFKLPSFHVISSHVVNVECLWLQSGSLGHIHGLVVRDPQVEEKKKKKKKKLKQKGRHVLTLFFFFFCSCEIADAFRFFVRGQKAKRLWEPITSLSIRMYIQSQTAHTVCCSVRTSACQSNSRNPACAIRSIS